jgi:signal transduction histidine kinase
MRWWLATAFAAVAGLTSVSVVYVLNARSAGAFQHWARAVALGVTVSAAEHFKADQTPAALESRAERVARSRAVAMFVFDGNGKLLTAATSHGVAWRTVPGGKRAVRESIAGDRYISGTSDGSALVVGVQIHGGAGRAVVVFALRPELRAQLGVVRNEFPTAAIFAFLIAAAVGLSIAILIGRRLARIADAARAIGRGDLTRTVHDRFPDEVGSLASSIEDMRRQLASSFATLRRDRARLEELIDRLNDGVLLVGPDLRVRYANGLAASLLGGRVELDGFLADFARGVFNGGGRNVRLTAPDGRRLLLSAIPPDDPSGDAIIVIEDQSRVERHDQAQREFATNAAHELRTPLASIVTAIEMLQTGAKDDPEVRDEFLDLIEQEANRLARLTRALLALARAAAREEQPRVSQFELKPVLMQVAESLRPPDQVTVRVECDDDLVALGNPILLEQAVASLATNAVQHTTVGTITLGAAVDDGSVVISVSDTGSGIPRERQGRIFERFYRAATDTPGFGLGMSIARDVVEALGGTIEVTSEPGSGTVVEIRLPVATREPVA